MFDAADIPIPEREIGKRVFFEHGDEATGKYVDEHSRILNDKMRKGFSNLERRRHLTYLVSADDVDGAVPKLSRIKGDCIQTLSRVRCQAHSLNGEERLRALQSQLRPKSDFTFSWDKLSQLQTRGSPWRDSRRATANSTVPLGPQ